MDMNKILEDLGLSRRGALGMIWEYLFDQTHSYELLLEVDPEHVEYQNLVRSYQRKAAKVLEVMNQLNEDY